MTSLKFLCEYDRVKEVYMYCVRNPVSRVSVNARGTKHVLQEFFLNENIIYSVIYIEFYIKFANIASLCLHVYYS